jgi:hypothetical protein
MGIIGDGMAIFGGVRAIVAELRLFGMVKMGRLFVFANPWAGVFS